MAAYALTQGRRATSCMLEAGGKWYALEGLEDADCPLRIAAARRVHAQRPFGEFDACDGGWDIEGEPYTARAGHAASAGGAAACSADAPITGAASRCASGPTTSAARRTTDSATTGRSRYDDVAPYYDRVDA